MSEKKVKEERKKNREVYTKIEITVFHNGDVDVSGPIGNFIFFTEIMTKAMTSVLEHTGREMKKIIEGASGNIVIPDIVPNPLKRRMN